MKRLLGFFFILVVTVLVFYPWFGSGVLGYGDWVHNLPERLNEYYRHFLIWDGSVQLGTSLGTSAPNNVVLYPIAWIMAVLQNILHISSSVTTRVFWYFPYIVFSLAGGWYLGWVITKRRLASTITAFLYTFSTFGLLTVQGGQMTVGNGYALAPLVLALVIMVRRSSEKALVLYLALAMWVQAIYDVRITYITLIAAAIYLIVANVWRIEISEKGQFKRFVTALFITALLSAYWAIPMFLTNSVGSGGLPTAADSAHWLPVLSYAEIEHTVASNHVWWPWSTGEQNPIQPLFLIGALLAGFGLMKLQKNKLTVSLLAIWVVGLFLAKGVNHPLGEVYEWLFNNMPGFSFFRDPAKFFTVVMLGLAPLAGIGAVNLWSILKKQWRLPVMVLVAIVLAWPLSDIVFTERHGTFVTHQIPGFSQELQNWYKDNTSGRTLWLPRTQRYIAATQDTPIIDTARILDNEWAPLATIDKSGQEDSFIRFLNHPYTDAILDRTGVKYIGVPYDTENEIFVHYSPRQAYIDQLNVMGWLTAAEGEPDNIDLYTNEGIKPAVYTASSIVAVEKDAFTAYDGLPDLNDQDALYVVDDSDGTISQHPITNQRSRLLSLTKSEEEWQERYNEWSFELANDFTGRLVFDSSLAGYDIAIDGQPLSARTNSQGVVVDDRSLTAGIHKLTISDNGAEDVIAADSFTSLDWQPCPGAVVTAIVSNNKEGETTFTSPLGQIASCIEAPVEAMDNGIYLMNANFTALNNAVVSIQTFYDLYSSATILGEPVKDNQNKAVVFTNTLNRPARIQLVLNADPESNSDGNLAVVLSNLKLSRLFSTGPEWMLIESDDQIALAPNAVDISQISPREYRATVKAAGSPYYLILNQAYSPAWNIRGVEVLDHLSLNGGINGWLIQPVEDTEISITYASATPYWLGIIITLLTIGFVKWQLFTKYKKS